MPRANLPILALLTLIWGTTWAVIRVGLQSIPPQTGAALRFGLAALVLLALARARHVPLGRALHERRLWVANGALSFAISYGIVYWAEQYIPSGLAAILFATFPLFVALWGHWLLPEERLTAGRAIGVVVGFLGIAVLYSEDLGRLAGPKATFAALVLPLAPLASALGQVVVKRWGKAVHPVSITALPMAFCSLVLGAIAAGTEGGRPIVWSAAAVLSVIYLAVVGSAVAFYLYFLLLARMKAATLSLVAYTSPLVAVLVGVVAFDEPVTWRIAVGTLTVLLGVGFAARHR